jgi:hypothetical protein
MFSYIKNYRSWNEIFSGIIPTSHAMCVVQVAVTNAVAQLSTPVGTWRTHFNYKKAKALAQAGNLIYCATEQGLFIMTNLPMRLIY